MGAVAQHEFNIVRVGAGADVLQHDGGFGVVSHVDGGRTKGGHALTSTGNGDLHRLVQLCLSVHSDNLCFRHGSPGLCGNTVSRGASGAKAGVVRRDGFGGYAFRSGDVDLLCGRRRKLTVVQAPQVTQGDKAPHLIAAMRDREVLHIE